MFDFASREVQELWLFFFFIFFFRWIAKALQSEELKSNWELTARIQRILLQRKRNVAQNKKGSFGSFGSSFFFFPLHCNFSLEYNAFVTDSTEEKS